MAEEKGLDKPVKLKADLAAFLGASSLPRTEITKKLWDYVKANKPNPGRGLASPLARCGR